MQTQGLNQNLGQPTLVKQQTTTTTTQFQQQPAQVGVAGVAAGGPLLSQNTIVAYVHYSYPSHAPPAHFQSPLDVRLTS